jgi:hypothetical protein
MAIGNIESMQQLNSLAAQIAGTFRSNAQAATELQAYVVGLGQAGLVALGFASADATTMLTQCSYMDNVAGVIQGRATVAADFNFVNAWVALTEAN